MSGVAVAVAACVGAWSLIGSVGPDKKSDSDTTAVQSVTEGLGSAVATVAPGASAPVGTADAIFGDDGKVKPAAYRSMAESLATAKGIEYRFGPAASGSRSGRPTAYEPADKPLDVHGNGPARTYQIGGPQNTTNNDFSSNQGQVGYVPDKGAPTLGVDHVATLEMGENTFNYQPRLTWTYYGRGHPEFEFTSGQVGAQCVDRIGASFGHTVALARAYAHGEAMASAFVAFDNGLIATAGHNTAQAGMCLKLPGGLRPSAISVTDGNEFVLVTAWDPKTLSSKLAVIAVGGARKADAQFWNYEWTELYPGMSNYGHPTFMKLLGLVDLPVIAPTGLSAVSNAPFGQQIDQPGHQGPPVQRGDFPLSNEANRQSFVDGANKSLRPTAGYAVVTSKSEHKAVFVDLQPLFSKVTGAYFGSRSTFDSVRGDIGQGDGQWPYAFSKAPAEAPKVLTTVSLKDAPTSVAAAITGARNPRAYIGTMDGTLHVFDAGGLATAADAGADEVKQVGTIDVGKNPTNITYPKDRAVDPTSGPYLPDDQDNTLIVTSRGDRKIDWVAISGDSGKIRRTLQDSRLVDPIAAEDNNNHGTESYVLSVADYGAGRLFNYRYGPVDYHTNGGQMYGMGPNGKSEFEFGGGYDPDGKPFAISVTNVT